MQSGTGKVHVTRQHSSVALAPKLWNRKAPSLPLPEVEEIILSSLLFGYFYY